MLSVIIPVYNVEKYVERCVSSVVSQTYRDLEIILVDDGSTDASGVICDLWKERDDRIKVIHKQNGGLSEARNAGLDIAAGDYVSFVDSDDYIHPQMYNILLQYMEQEEADIVCCKFRRVKEDTAVDFSPVDKENSFTVLNSTEALLDLSITDVTACNKLFRSSIFREIRFVNGRYHEDEWLIHRVLYECNKIVAVEAGFYYYVMRNDSITHTFSEKKTLDGVEAYMDRVFFVIEKDWKEVQKQVVVNCLEHLIWAYTQENSKRKEWNRCIKKYYRKVVKEAIAYRIPMSRSYFLFAIHPKLYNYRI